MGRKDKINIGDYLISNKAYIYPAMFYVAGLVLGATLFHHMHTAALTTLMKELFKVESQPFLTLFINRISLYLSIYTVTVLMGLCLIGFPFVNFLPLLLGTEIALKTAYFYVNYGAKGIAFSVLMIAPESAAFMTLLLYTIKTASELSKYIYHATMQKEDMSAEEISLQTHLRKFLLYGVITIVIALFNAFAMYFLSTIIKI